MTPNIDQRITTEELLKRIKTATNANELVNPYAVALFTHYGTKGKEGGFVDFDAISAAIINRWTYRGLVKINNSAWDIVEAGWKKGKNNAL